MAISFSNDGAWQQVKVGAGGWITGIDIAPDGTMVGRADTYGAYLWNGGKWVQMVTVASMPTDVYEAAGVYEIRVAPSDSNIFYMEMNGGLFKSIDKGAHWTKTAFPATVIDANGENRTDDDKMAIDPVNANIVFAGTQKNGLFVTHDGGTSWQSVGAVPRGADAATAADPSLTGIVFDPTGGSSNGATNVIYAATVGSGVFRSANGGATWTPLDGSPKDVAHSAIGGDGSYYAVGNSQQNLWKYSGGTWTQLISGNDVQTVAVDPFNSTHLVAVRTSGNLQESHDAGATWSGWQWNQTLESSTDIPWLENSGAYMSSGQLLFDPLVHGRLWQSAGVGVWSTDLTSDVATSSITWNSHSLGIEQLVANDIIAGAGDNPVLASWDRAFFEVSDANAYPTTYSGGSFSMGWSLDYASTKSSFVVGISDWYGTENSGFSTDGGHTWQKFASMPSFAGSTIGGSIAASSPTSIIWAPAGGYAPAYTTDGGATWTSIKLPDTADWSSLHQGYWLDRTTITADRVLDKTYYLYNVATGVYVTHDGGANWTKVHTGEIAPWSQFNAKIEAVPGSPGELFFTSGPQGDGTPTTPSNNSFMHSTDGGATWTAVAGVKEVDTFGYGAPASAAGPSSIYIAGWVNNVYGVWYSTNDAQSWTQIGKNPGGSLDGIKTISGDMDQFGGVYVGFGGSGYAHLSIAGDTPPPPPAPPAPPSQTVTLTGAVDNVGPTVTVASGALINDGTPTLSGTLSATLSSGQVLAVYRDGQKVGQLSPTTTSWSYTDSGASDGTHGYSARVEDGSGQAGASSNAFSLAIDTVAPAQQLSVTSATDNFGPSTGTLGNGATTDDSTPQLHGLVSAPLAAGDVISVFRDGVRVGAATVANGQWDYTDANVAAGAHSYTAQISDAAGNVGAMSGGFALTVAADAMRSFFGTTRSDTVVGSAGADRISGIPDSGINLGKGTIDVLTGNGGSDLFVLGDARGRFYDDGRAGSSGTGDYARITDFGSDDHLQLKGSAASYFQHATTVNGASGTGIYFDSNGNGVFDSRDELIALIQNHGPLDASAFLFM